MKIVKAKIDFTLKGIYYEKGDDIKIESKEDLIRLNERGFIEPITLKDIQNFDKNDKNDKNREEV